MIDNNNKKKSVYKKESFTNNALIIEFLNTNSHKSVIKLLLFLARKNKIIFLGIAVTYVKAYAVTWIAKSQERLTDAVAIGNKINIKIAFIAAIVIAISYKLIKFVNEYLENKSMVALDKTLSILIYEYIKNQDADYRSQISITKININTNNLLRMSKIFQKFVRILGLLVELFFVVLQLVYNGNKFINISIVIFFAVYIIFFLLIDRPHVKATLLNAQSWNRMNESLNNICKFLNTINIFNSQKKVYEDFSIKLNDSLKIRNHMFFIRRIIIIFTDFLFTAWSYGVFFFIIKGIYEKQFSIGFLTLYGILIHMAYHAVREILSELKIFEDFGSAKEALNSIFFKELDKSIEYQDQIDTNKKQLLITNPYDIHLKNLLVHVKNYDEKYNKIEEIIVNIDDLQIKEKEKYIIVGLSGCGKTTLAGILVGLAPYSGSYTIGGEDISQISFKSLRENVTLISQQTDLLPVSIRENIQYSKQDATEEEIYEAAKKAYIHDIIMALPMQYDTIVKDASGLSGGEKQRIALARMFLSNAKIIILDESTSSLDVPTELKIYHHIVEYATDKTIIVIAHRMAVLNYFDNIIFMENGKIMGQGKHHELLKNNNKYYNFINCQSDLE